MTLDLSDILRCGNCVCVGFYWFVGFGELPLMCDCLFICYSFVLRELLFCYVSYGMYCCCCVLGLIA